MKKDTLKTKTFWAGIASIATGISLLCAGEQSEGIEAIVFGLVVISARDTAKKFEK